MGLAANQIPPDLKEKIHQEYVTTDISLRGIAKKYGLAKTTLYNWSKKEMWSQEKDMYLLHAEQAARCAFEAETDHHINLLADRARRIYDSADRLLDKVNQLLELDDALSPRDLKSISSTLLDLKMIHNIKDESDEKQDNTVHVVFDDWED